MGKGFNSDKNAEAILGPGGGELGELIRSFEWDRTPLGPISSWPQALITAVRIMLASRQPIWIGWGPELIYLYNDPYKSIIGGKHPAMLGQPTSVVWSEIWNEIGPMLRTAMGGVEGTYVEEQLLIMERSGYPEETYYTFSYTPISNDDGGVGGIFCANTDDTAKVIGRRRLQTLRDVGERTLEESRSANDACHAAAGVLEQNPYDVPFSLIYLLDEDGTHARLAESVRIESGSSPAPATVEIGSRSDIWGFESVLRSGKVKLVKNLGKKFGRLTAGAWGDDQSKEAVILPLTMSRTQSSPSGFLVAGISPRLPFGDEYSGFLALVAGHIATAVANAHSYEEEKRRADALAELDRAKTEFFSNVSHEFRTPLTLTLGNLEELANDSAIPPAQKEWVDSAHRNSLRLLRLVNTLLDFSRIEAGRAAAHFEEIDVVELTSELASSFRSAIEASGLTLKIEGPPLATPAVVDREMWEKIVLNLLSNAYKFTLKGEIQISIKEIDGSIVLEVRDTGVGIPETDLDKVFDRFHRVRGTSGRSHEGTGIGLALVRELVDLHGGTISVESKPNEGTTFTVEIPAGQKGSQLNGMSENRSGGSAHRGYLHNGSLAASYLSDLDLKPETPTRSDGLGEEPTARLLLVDDNQDMRGYISRLLRDAGFDVETATDGAEALELAKMSAPDLILSDVMMPRMNGFELLSAIRSDETLRSIPFIMLSARAGEESKVEGLDAGADDYLIKPFSVNELLARVRAHINLRRHRADAERLVRASDDRYRAFIQNSSEGIWRFELDEPIPTDLPVDRQIELAFEQGYLAECNDAFARQYGFDQASDVIGARLPDMLVPDDPQNREYLRAFIESDYRLTDAESHELDRHGNDRYFLNNLVGVIENGNLIRAWGTQRDVTETKDAQRATALLAGIVASSEDAIISKDLDGYITSWNRGAENIFGYTPKEAIGRHISMLAIDGSRRDSDEILRRTKNGERVEHYETVQVRKNGSRVPVALSASPIYDKAGNIVGVSKIARDVTEQKRARTMLDRYRLLSEQARDIILFIDPKSGRIVEANHAAALTYGYKHDELLKLSIREIRSPETLDVLDEQYRIANESGIQFETIHVRRDGTNFPVEVNSIGADIGSERFLISIVRDISERKAAEEAFMQNQAILALAMESSQMGAWTRDLKTGHVWWSEELESIFGLPQGAFSQSRNAFYDLVHEEDREVLLSEVERSIAEHRSYTAEFRFSHSDGTVRWLEGRGQAVYSESGEPVRIYGVGIDITERRKLQELVVENEERFRGLMEQAPLSIQLLDTTGRTIRVNRSWELLWGVSADQIVDDYNILEDPQLEAKGITPYLRRAFAGEAVEVPPILYDPNETLPGRTANVEPKRWVSAVAYPLKAADGTVKEVALVHQDITARRNAEESVRQTLGQLALITNIAPVFISHYDRNERLKFANRAFTERYDLHPEDCIGKHVSTIIGGDAYGAVHQYIKRVLKGEAVEFDVEVPYPVIGKRYVHVSYAPEFDANGDVAGYVAATTDITEHRRAEEEIRRVNERFQIAERASKGFIYDWNLRTDVVTRTEGFNRVLGYGPGEIPETGEAWLDLVHQKDLESNNIREMLASGAEHTTSEYRVQHKNGSWIWFRDEAAVILDARGGAVRMIGSTVDITARKLAENRLVLLAQVSELIRTVGDPAELMYEVARVTGEHLEIRRCLFNEIDLEKDTETVHKDYCSGATSVAGTNKISDYSSLTLQEMMQGRTVVNNDAETDPRTSDIYERTYKPNGERAYVAVPLLREGKWVASMWSSDDTPRQWRGAEIKLLETIAERTWTAVERLRLDIARRESEERFTKAFNSSPLSLTISSLKTGELIAVNDTFVQLSGYSREEAIGKTTVDLGLWARVQDRKEEMEQVRRTGQVRNVEYEFVVRNGSVVIGLLSAEKVEISGEPFALTVIQDITEQRRAQQALLRAERRAAEEYLELLERIIPLAEALGTAPDTTTIYRSLGSFISASMKISAFFVSFYDAEKGLRLPAYVWGEGEEIDISELPPMPITPGGGPNSQAIFERRAVITNSYWEQQKDRPHMVVRDNGINPNSSLVVPMMLQNKVLGTLEVQAHANAAFNNEHAVALEMAANLAAVSIENLRLIETEALARSEAETANRMKDEFLSVLSHELRTPLNAMLGWIRIMRGGGLDEQRTAKALEIIERNTRQQSSLIEDLLDVSRIISGKMRVEKELIDLTPTLNAVAETIRPLAAAKDVIFLVEGDDEPLYMRGDAVRLQQVVTNLLQNSVKFTPAGGVVTLSHRRSGLMADLTVQDTGVGIAKDFLPHIFDRFSQADLSTKRSNTGLGLGLTIVSNIVELHGGHITADSDGPGTGATFRVQLPLTPELYQQFERPSARVQSPAGSIEGLKMLVVDDDLESTIPLKILLEREGAEVTCVDTAGEALEQLRELDYDILISDIGMPMMDGYELITNLRLGTASRNSNVRAIAFTAYASEDDRRKLEEAGFDAHVAKPLDFDELLRVVAKLAKNHRT